MRTIAAWWREFSKYSTTSTRAKVTLAVISAVIGLLAGMGVARASVATPHKAPASQERRGVATRSWTDAMGYKYKAHIRSLGGQSVSFDIRQDSGHQWMHAWAKCDSGDRRTGPNTKHAGDVTTTAPLCPAGNIGLHQWGIQSYQYYRTVNHRWKREWVTHIFGCNVGSC